MKRYSMAKMVEVKIGEKIVKKPRMIEDSKGEWIRFKDIVDDAKGLADALIEFGNEMLELIGEEEE